jgi:hypothetical protein
MVALVLLGKLLRNQKNVRPPFPFALGIYEAINSEERSGPC